MNPAKNRESLFSTLCDVWKYTPVGGVAGFATVVSCIGLPVAYLMSAELENGFDFLFPFFFGVSIASGILFLLIPSIASASYPLCIALPLRTSKISQVLSLTADICYICIAAVECLMVCLLGAEQYLLFCLTVVMIKYCIVHFGMYLTAAPGMKTDKFVGGAMKGFGLFLLYILMAALGGFEFGIMSDYFETGDVSGIVKPLPYIFAGIVLVSVAARFWFSSKMRKKIRIEEVKYSRSASKRSDKSEKSDKEVCSEYI